MKLEVDRALKKKWEATLKQIETAKNEGASAFDSLWENVGAVIDHDPPLYLAAGLATTKAFLATHVGETERTARRLVRVAKYASPHEEEKYGTTKLDAVINYVEAKAGHPAKGRVPVDFAALRIPVERDGATRKLKVEETTVEEINRATRALARSSKKVSKEPAAAHSVRKVLVKKLAGVSVRVAGDRLYLGSIPLSAVPDLAKALAKLPVIE